MRANRASWFLRQYPLGSIYGEAARMVEEHRSMALQSVPLMIFNALMESGRRGELILIDGGFCRYHLRRDGQLTICEIIALRKGAGGEMLAKLRHVTGATSIFAKCPAALSANVWYEARGFEYEGLEMTRAGSRVNKWRLVLH